MKTNWLWDSRLGEDEIRKILKDADNPRFDIYAEKLFSRTNDPRIAFSNIDKVTFCKNWPNIKKRMRKDRWLKDRVIFWQAIYERIHEGLKGSGIRLRKSREAKIPPERMKLAQQIRSIRMKSGYTQGDVAKKLGTVQQYISKIENGHENLSVDTLARIANVFSKGLVIKLK